MNREIEKCSRGLMRAFLGGEKGKEEKEREEEEEEEEEEKEEEGKWKSCVSG